MGPSCTMSGIAVGLNKGHVVDKIANKAQKPSRRKGTLGKRVSVVREVIREVVGLAPYEKRLLDILKTGANNPDKKVYKMAKNRLGSHKRALRKRDEIKRMYQAFRANAAAGTTKKEGEAEAD